MDWFLIAIIAVVLLLIIWAVNRSTAGYYKAEINRLEQKIDFLFKKSETDYNREMSAYLPERVRELAQAGRKIEAIKAYRLATGADLVIAKKFVEGLSFPATDRQGNESTSPEIRQPGSTLSPGVKALVHDRQKIQAIKLYREQTGVGLKEAKDAVELYERELKLK